MTIKMKRVTLDDINDLQQISIETFSDTFGAENKQEDLDNYLQSAYNQEKLKKEVSDPNSDFQLIYYNDELAGYIKLNVNESQTELKDINALEVERIYIRTVFHRLGLGKKLINYAFEQAESQNKSYVWLGVWEHNTGAIAFYNKQGFTVFSEHIFKLGNDPQRDVLMKKEM